MKSLRKCVMSPKMTRTGDLNAQSSTRIIPMMMTFGIDDFHHGNFAFDDASPLSAEL
jgi:hypothetical protein